MNLLAPWMLLAGALAAAAFTVLHLRGRRRVRTVPFAAVRFLPPPSEPKTRRRRVEDRWLLAARVALALALAFAAARPHVEADTHLAVYGTPHDAIVVLDGSASTAAVLGPGTVRDAIALRARELVDALPAGSRVGLAFTDPERPGLEPTEDFATVRERIDAWRDAPPRPVARALGEAVAEAAALVPAGSSRPLVLYPIGDHTAGGVPSVPRAAGTTAVLPDAVPDAPPDVRQAWFASVRWTPDPAVEPGAVRIEAELRRMGSWPGDRLPVAFEVEGREIARTEAAFADDRSTVVFTHVLDDPTTPVAATLRIVADDALPADDTHTLWLQADERVDVLVVDGAPSELRPHDEVFYLVTALGVAKREPALEVTVQTPNAFAQRLRDDDGALGRTDVLVLANVPAPDPAVASAVAQAVDRGMGLWITAGDHVLPADYNRTFGPLLPLALRDAKVTGTLPGRAEAKAEHLAPPNLDDPLLSGAADLDLSTTTTHRLLLLEPTPDAEVDTALTFQSGAPALLSAQRGRGRVALLTTTLDRDWTDLPLQPGFVALCEAVVRNLARGRGGGHAGRRIRPGAPRPLSGTAPWTVELPDGSRRTVTAGDEDGAAVFDETWQLGAYEVRDAEQRVVDRFSVVFDPAESDLRPQPAPARDPGLEAGVTEIPRSAPLAGRVLELAAWLLLFEAALRVLPGIGAPWRRRR
ncbi:MAG: VWA domain-containing protein [Deltaproteobacteria bacterium]|nr:MAG: VWA domain-containing protein [Deltaproteobacteria bacterium]